MPRYFSLKNKLSLSIAIMIIAMGSLVCFLVFFYLNNFLMKEKYKEIQDKTIEKSVETERVLENNYLFIKMVATKGGIQEYLINKYTEGEEEGEEGKEGESEYIGQEKRLQKSFDAYAKDDSKYLSIYLMDRDGNTLISTDRSFIGNNYGFREYFKKSMNGSPAMDSILGKTSNQFGFYFSHPVKDETEEVLGVVVAKVSGREIFRENLSAIRLGMDNIFLVDEFGIVVGAIDERHILKSLGDLKEDEKKTIDESRRFSGREIESFDYGEAKELLDGYYAPKNIKVERTKNIFGVSKIFNSDLFIISRVDLKKVENSIYPIILIVVSGIFIACVLVSLFVYLLTRNSLASLKKIKIFSEKLSGGDFSQKIVVNDKNEIGDLAETFNSLGNKLKNYYSNLEKKVSEKTFELEKNKNDLENQQKAILNILDDVDSEKKNISLEKEKIDAILHSIGDGVFVVDEKLEIVMINNVTSEISGFSEKELIGKKYNSVLKFIFEKNGEENRKFIDLAISTGKVQEMANHTILIKKDKNKVPVADSAAPLKNKEGKVIGCVVVFRDVFKEREIDRMKTEFVSLASHQLRTPLTSIKWYTELLLADEKNDKLVGEKREFIQEIQEGNKRMIDLVNDLLNVSHIETGKKFVIDKKEEDIILIIEQAIKEQEVIAKQKNIKIVYDGKPEGKLTVSIDGTKIKQIIQNFISNAIKYSPKETTITVGFKEDDGQHIFYVKDQGAGIPKEQQGQIFEKFFRASNVILTGVEGTGLGLYIAEAIIKGHGGKIWFESVENEGTTFFISLPKEAK